MCLLVLCSRIVPDAPLVLGANREEAYARIGEPPQVLPGMLRVVAGRDPTAGGTWLGLNERGVLVAVTNRFKSHVHPMPRSRGLLVRDLLECASAGAAVDRAARELSSNRYAGCNLVCGDVEGLYTIHAGDWLRVRPLPPGVHVLTTADVDDEKDPRIVHAFGWLEQRRFADADGCVAALQELCAAGPGVGPPICLHGEDRGTVSSSIVTLRQPLARSEYRHAQGPPDRTPYVDYSHLIEEIAPRD